MPSLAPRVPAARLHNLPDCYKIKLRSAGYRLVYQVDDKIVLVTVYLSSAILAEAGLSFLGLGTQPPEPSWGGMLNAARTYMELSPWMAVAPGFAIALVVLGLNFLGDGLRDVLDPRLRIR